MSKAAAFIVGLLALLLGTPVALAALPSAPALTVHEAYFFENVSQSGDGLLLYRASLPETNWATYTADGAIARFTETTVHAQQAPPDIGEFIGGMYLAAGQTVTFGATATLDLLSNPSLFSTSTSSQVGVTYVATTGLIATSTADQNIMCSTFQTLAQNVEAESSSDDIDVGDLYTGLIFSQAGTVMATNAFAIAALVLPNCFIVGLESTTAFNPNSADLETTQTATVEGTDAWTRFDALAADYGFDDATLAAALLGLGATGIMFIIVSILSGSFMYGSVAGAYSLLWAGMAAPHYLLKLAFVAAAVGSVGAGAFWFGKTPK